MIIFFGTRGKRVSGNPIQSLTCPHCGNSSHQSFGIVRYFHIFWISVFPIKKLAGIECLNCRKTRLGKDLPTPTLNGIKNVVFGWKNTLPLYTGLVLIVGLLASGLVADEIDTRNEQSYLAAPQVHDYYLVDFTKIFNHSDTVFRYGIMRVKSVFDEQIELQVSNYAYNKRTGPRQALRRNQANRSDYYAEQKIYFDLAEIKHLKASGAIYSVERG